MLGAVESQTPDLRLIGLHAQCPIDDEGRFEKAVENPLVLLATGQGDQAAWSRIADEPCIFIDGLRQAQRLTGAAGAVAFNRDVLGKKATALIRSRPSWRDLAPSSDFWADESAAGDTVVGTDKYAAMAKENSVRPISLLQTLRIVAAHEVVIDNLVAKMPSKKQQTYERAHRLKRLFANLAMVPAVSTIKNASGLIAELREKMPRVDELVSVTFEQPHDRDTIYRSYWPAKKHREYLSRKQKFEEEGRAPEVLFLLEGIEKGFGVTLPTARRLSLALKELQDAKFLESFGGEVDEFSTNLKHGGSYRYEPFKFGQFIRPTHRLEPFSLKPQAGL